MIFRVLRFFALSLLSVACSARAAEPLALRDGEKFTYKVSWAFLPGAGEIKVAVERDPAFNEPRLRVVTTTATRGVARMILAFDARSESLFDPVSGRLVSLREWSQQRDKSNDHTVMFDYVKKQALYTEAGVTQPRTLALPEGNPMDLITQLVQTRSWTLQPGEKRDALVLFNDDFYDLTIHAARREEVKTPLGRQTREVVSGGGHVSGQSGWVHFGLGDATSAEIRVRWPGEDWSRPYAVKANRFALIDKAASAAALWTPPR